MPPLPARMYTLGRELVELFVQPVAVMDGTINPASVERTRPARPFFGEGAWRWRPRTDLSPQQPRRLAGLLPRGRVAA